MDIKHFETSLKNNTFHQKPSKYHQDLLIKNIIIKFALVGNKSKNQL